MNPFAVWVRRVFQKSLRRSRRPAGPALRVETLEDRIQPSTTGYEPINGVGNNVANPTWGSAGIDLVRLAAAAYADGVSTPSLPTDQSARAISNILNNQADPNDPGQDLNTIDQQSLSDFGYAFGQFIDHDLDLTPDGGASFPITVAANDPIGPDPLPFTRSQTDPSTGTSSKNPLQQVTTVTSYLDLSQVYGSDAVTADSLRSHVGGQMKTSPGNLLPLDNSTYFPSPETPPAMANNGGLPNSQLFATGDVRGNENIELTALQTLFVRNHNRLAALLQKQHPTWSDEQLYQEARKLNIATYQMIVYNEWLPAVLGPRAIPAYAGYNPNVNATIGNEFSTVAFRFGHSLLSSGIERQANNGLDIATSNGTDPTIPLYEDFFDPTLLNTSGIVDPLTGLVSSDIDPILKGDADGVSQANDLLAIEDVRNLLFGNYGAGGEDLMARDVQRGRDNGIPDYNTLRVALGLPAVTTFAQITSNVQVQQELAAAYPGGVNTIDAFEGGLAEDHVPGSDVGPLFQAIIANQFTRLRDGDRFFYLNESFTPDEVALIRGATLAKVIEANTHITNLQSDVMVFRASIGGTVVTAGPAHGFPAGVAGITVQLQDTGGTVLATTVTDAQGHYHFDQLSGVSATGQYNVRLVLPAGDTQASANPATILISRGDTSVGWVDFTITTPAPAATHFGVFVVSPAVAGQPTIVLVVALDAHDHVVTGYTGTVQLGSSTDSTATLPARYTFSAADGGAHLFRVTFDKTGNETLSVGDGSIGGSILVDVLAPRKPGWLPWAW